MVGKGDEGNCQRQFKSSRQQGPQVRTTINRILKDLALHYGCVIDPTRPYHPQDKALVEDAVRLVYQLIYYPLSKQTFFSLGQLNQAIRNQLDAYNDYSFQNRKTTRCQQFLEQEQQELDPLPVSYQVRFLKRAKRCRRSTLAPDRTTTVFHTAVSVVKWKCNIPIA